jgi:hypothetical protein
MKEEEIDERMAAFAGVGFLSQLYYEKLDLKEFKLCHMR